MKKRPNKKLGLISGLSKLTFPLLIVIFGFYEACQSGTGVIGAILILTITLSFGGIQIFVVWYVMRKYYKEQKKNLD